MEAADPSRVAPMPALEVLLAYGLDQLPARNAHHEFEHLCFALTQRKITAAILPATGPVGKYGDAGADFETHIIGACAGDGGLKGNWVFACSLAKDVPRKVKADIGVVLERAHHPDGIAFFSSQNVTAGERERLRGYARANYRLALEIYDRQALIHWLAEEALHDLAEQFLHIPVSYLVSQPYRQLRALSRRQLEQASTIAASRNRAGQIPLTAIHIKRDIEDEILESICAAESAIGLVIGQPGHGKTTLLWSIARDLPEHWEPWFFQSATLQGDLKLLDRLGFRGGHPDIVRAIAIDSAVRGKRPMLLMDTVDLLLHREEDAAVLEALIAAARECRCPLLMSSRPAEAEELRKPDISQFVLQAYSETEFARAVRRHSEFFCPDLVRDEEERRTESLLAAVARGEPIREIVLNPLTLRMLFEVYAPEDISHADINVIALYRRYWDMRVADDRRGGQKDRGSGLDLSLLTEELALVMLEEGTTVLTNTHISHAMVAAGANDSELQILADRGVLQPAGERRIGFFHQSFFEFAAARALYRQFGLSAVSEFRLLLSTSPDDLLRLPVLEQLLVLCSGGSVGERQTAALELNRLSASTSLAERRSAVYVYALWQQGEPADFDPAQIVRDHTLVIRRFYELAGNIDAQRIDAVFLVLDALWQLPSPVRDPEGRENWRKKENSLALLQRFALRAPDRMRQFIDSAPVLADAVVHLAGAVDIADVIRALIVLARSEPDWSLDKLLWLYQEALHRYSKRDTQRKILLLLAENPDCFPLGYCLASKIAARTDRRIDIPIDSERITAAFGRLWLREWREAALTPSQVLMFLKEDADLPKDLPLAACFSAVTPWVCGLSPDEVDLVWAANQQMPEGGARDRLCLALCRAVALDQRTAGTQRIAELIRDLLASADCDEDWIRRFADGIHDSAMADGPLSRLLGHPRLLSAELWLKKPYHILIPAAVGLSNPGSTEALRSPETLPVTVLKSLCQCFRNANTLGPAAVDIAFRLFFADQDVKALAALVEKLADGSLTGNAQRWSSQINEITLKLLKEPNPDRRVFGYRLLRATVRLGVRPPISVSDALAWIRRECPAHTLLYVLELGALITACSVAGFEDILDVLAPKPGWTQESLREAAGRFIFDVAEPIEPLPYATAVRAFRKLQEIRPSGRVLAKFIYICRDMAASHDQRHDLIVEFLTSDMVQALPRDGFRGFSNIIERPLIEMLRQSSPEQVRRWIPHARVSSPLQPTILRVLLRAAFPMISREAESWPIGELSPDVQNILAQHRTRRHTKSVPWIRLSEIRRRRSS